MDDVGNIFQTTMLSLQLACAGADLYERCIQTPLHRWQKCITNGGDYVEK
jgi:hypothetical protein